MFHQLADITRAIDMWQHHRIFVLHDALDIPVRPNFVEQLREVYPAIFEFWTVEWFPAGFPAVAPPALFFFYNRMRSADQLYFWTMVVEMEYAAIFSATWWHEAERGQRAFILPSETIDWIRQYLYDDYPIDGETTKKGRYANAAHVFDRMEESRGAPQRFIHQLTFPGTHLTPSRFVLARQGTGQVQYAEGDGLPWCGGRVNNRLVLDVPEMHRQGDPSAGEYAGANLQQLQWQGVQRRALQQQRRQQKKNSNNGTTNEEKKKDGNNNEETSTDSDNNETNIVVE